MRHLEVESALMRILSGRQSLFTVLFRGEEVEHS